MQPQRKQNVMPSTAFELHPKFCKTWLAWEIFTHLFKLLKLL